MEQEMQVGESCMSKEKITSISRSGAVRFISRRFA